MTNSFWDDAFEEVAKETAASHDKTDPDKIARKIKEEHERGVRNGWHDEEGNSLLPEDEEDEEEEDEEE